MVERFNRTLTAMLSAYVNENHTNGDQNIPFVMMAYRSSEHETTGMTPNMLMLGREVSTPLDLMYERPMSVKEIPVNTWVWELQERIESAHTFVREKTGQAMQRQKHIHDRQLSFEKFKVNDLVYVYFPVKKIGTSSKFTSFWRGPYKIISKLSDVLYKVNCGRDQAHQVIHCDRIRKCRDQILLGENDTRSSLDLETQETPNSDPESYENADTSPDVLTEEVCTRRRKPPVWAKDYVFSLSRETKIMAKTKVTPRKPGVICPGCKETVSGQFQEHLKGCKDYKKRHACSVCSKTFKRKFYMLKHERTVHGKSAPKVTGIEMATTTGSPSWELSPKVYVDKTDSSGDSSFISTESESEQTDEPREEMPPMPSTSSLPEDLLLGRTMRKQTKPSKPLTNKRKAEDPLESIAVPAKCQKRAPETKLQSEAVAMIDVAVGTSVTLIENGTQTDFKTVAKDQPKLFECEYCGVFYTSQVMCHLHKGCHTIIDPFRCNICGKSCGERFEFYTHITRGHE